MREPRVAQLGRRRGKPGAGPVTYSNQIARILRKNCVDCHRPGEAAPFALTTFAEVDGWAETIGEGGNGRSTA